jgi:nucleoside-diphosphate-sugar epimerase
MLKRAKIAVTGGAGFIGAALANELSASHEVIVLDDFSSGNHERLLPSIKILATNLATASVSELISALHDVEYVCHLAAVKLHNVDNASERVIATNIVGTQNLLLAAAEAGVKRVLFTSSLYAYGSMGPNISTETDVPAPRNVYGASKLIGEEMLKIASSKYGYSTVSPRLFFVYGPRQFSEGGYKSVIVNSCERLLAARPALINGDGRQALDYIYIDDCVSALKELLFGSMTGVFNVCNAEAISINQVVKTLASFSEFSKIEFVDADWTAGSIRYGNNKKLISESKWRPRVSLEDGLRKTWDYHFGKGKGKT